jgi:CBS domain-containing protein
VPLDLCATCEQSAGFGPSEVGSTTLLCRHRGEEAAARGAPHGLHRDARLADKLSMPVSELMTPTAICVRKEMHLDRLAATLLEHGVGALPVVDEHGTPIGVVTKTDLLRARTAESAPPVGEPSPPPMVDAIMTSIVLTLHERASVAQACALLAYEGIHRLPVVDDSGRVVGVLSSLDVLHWLGEQTGYLMRKVAPHHR